MRLVSDSSPILITGAAGFIGSHVAQALQAEGRRVEGVDNFDPFYARAIKQRNVLEAGLSPRNVHDCDITDDVALGEVFDRVRPAGVIHLAAKAGVRPSIADPAGYMHANVTGTARVLQHASRVGCARVVVASSSSVYGNVQVAGGAFHEELDVSAPISPYAASKRACELLAWSHHHLTGLPIACLRFFTVFGPRQRPDLAIGMFLSKVAQGQPINLFGDGSTARDYTYVDDIVQGVVRAYDRSPVHGVRIWNLGNHQPVTLRDMIATVEHVVGTPARVQLQPKQAGDVERTCADITRATRELGYIPATSFADGVAKHWAWLRERTTIPC